VLITNATLWTNTSEGRYSGWLLLRAGKIAALGKGEAPEDIATSVPGIRVIRAQGKHVTPGIIDAHSHTGISRGVNEGGQAITAEVRIQDVTNPDDVNWYRQLAGGVTSVLSLHGSANAIGGQSQVNKLRWGCASPNDMHFHGALPGIKFALGENPRQINWSAGGNRYPATRMGVEALIRDRFTAAREYAANPSARRDLELEPLVEILAGKRLIHCHSYRQDEILMLGEVAKDFGFTIGTYQHILEGYKVAEVVRDRAGGGSGFADWWAYKAEVQDAIPQAFIIMHKVGAVASYNSDSNELARRLNTEAAKAVKYGHDVGGLSEEEALKFVTLNPAKQLKIDSMVGALRTDMAADVVIWSSSPLSSYARAEHTFVDGRELFSLEQDKQHRSAIEAERARLIQKLLKDGEKSKDAKPAASRETSPGSRRRRPTDLELEHLIELHNLQHMSGKDPRLAPGVCGCGFTHAFD
jgi:imidazolonepropionase-like amidohydrolase